MLQEAGYCYGRPNHAFIWRNSNFGTLGKQKSKECFKYFLTGHTSRNMKDNGVKNNLNCWGLAHGDSKENFSMLPRDHSFDILKKVVAFCLCPKSLLETKVKIF